MEPTSPTMQADSLPSELPGKPIHKLTGCFALVPLYPIVIKHEIYHLLGRQPGAEKGNPQRFPSWCIFLSCVSLGLLLFLLWSHRMNNAHEGKLLWYGMGHFSFLTYSFYFSYYFLFSMEYFLLFFTFVSLVIHIFFSFITLFLRESLVFINYHIMLTCV